MYTCSDGLAWWHPHPELSFYGLGLLCVATISWVIWQLHNGLFFLFDAENVGEAPSVTLFIIYIKKKGQVRKYKT
jgi:hypothetical protein